jgi:hypothetical protein
MLASPSFVQAALSSCGWIVVRVELVRCGLQLHLCCITLLPRIVFEFPQTTDLFEDCAYHTAWLLFEFSFMNFPHQGILRLPGTRLNGSCRMDSITAVTSSIAVVRCTHWLLKFGSHHYIAADNNTSNPSLAADAGAGNNMGFDSTGCSCVCSAELGAAVVDMPSVHGLMHGIRRFPDPYTWLHSPMVGMSSSMWDGGNRSAAETQLDTFPGVKPEPMDAQLLPAFMQCHGPACSCGFIKLSMCIVFSLCGSWFLKTLKRGGCHLPQQVNMSQTRHTVKKMKSHKTRSFSIVQVYVVRG